MLLHVLNIRKLLEAYITVITGLTSQLILTLTLFATINDEEKEETFPACSLTIKGFKYLITLPISCRFK